MTWVFRIATGLIFAAGLCLSGRVIADRTTFEASERLDPHHDPSLKADENCGICHDVTGYYEGAHGDAESGVYRLSELPRGDCLHCHDFDAPYLYYLFMPYNTNQEQRDICLFCHDGVSAPFPSVPPEQHGEVSMLPCVECHNPHDPQHGGGSGDCAECHGDTGSHATHTLANNKGPATPLLCEDCHVGGTFPLFEDGHSLEETAVCDDCHSEGGAYNGLHNDAGGSVGAKDNWDDVYTLTGDALLPGKEKWCIGCHDAGTSVVSGASAPNVDLHYSGGHGRTGAAQECLVCHDVNVGMHVDGQARTYSFDTEYYPFGSSGVAYAEGYRLRYIGGDVPLMVPANYGITFNYNAALMKANAFRLCFSCHDPGQVLDDTPGDGIQSNFKATLPNPPRDYSYAWGSGADVNEHVAHIMNYLGPFADSDWDVSTVGPGGVNGHDTMTGCTSCHNVHGAIGLAGSTNEAMIRDGRLAGRPGGYGFSYVTEDAYPWVTSMEVTKQNSVGAILRYNTEPNNMCGGGMCHGNPNPPPDSRYDATGHSWGTYLEYYRPWAPYTENLLVLSQVSQISGHSPPDYDSSSLIFTAQFQDADGISRVQVAGYSSGERGWVYADLGEIDGMWTGGPDSPHDWVESPGYYFKVDDGLHVTFLGCGGRQSSSELGDVEPEADAQRNTYPFGGGRCSSEVPVAPELVNVSVAQAGSCIELSWTCLSVGTAFEFRILRDTGSHSIPPELLATLEASDESQYGYLDESVAPGETYFYWIEAADHDGLVLQRLGPWGITVEGSEESELQPRSGPNPVKDLATIRFHLSSPGSARLDILAVDGKLVRSLRAGGLTPGAHEIVWDLRDGHGRLVSKGPYFYTVHVGETEVGAGKVTVLR